MITFFFICSLADELSKILSEHHNWTLQARLLIYEDSPTVQVRREPKNVDIFSYTSSEFKTNTYYFSDEYKPSEFKGWEKLYDVIYMLCRSSGCSIICLRKRTCATDRRKDTSYTIGCFRGRLSKHKNIKNETNTNVMQSSQQLLCSDAASY